MKTAAAFAFFFLICAVILSVLPVHGEAEIYDSVIRLHVLAHSDSEADQALKLLVRDPLEALKQLEEAGLVRLTQQAVLRRFSDLKN